MSGPNPPRPTDRLTAEAFVEELHTEMEALLAIPEPWPADTKARYDAVLAELLRAHLSLYTASVLQRLGDLLADPPRPRPPRPPRGRG